MRVRVPYDGSGTRLHFHRLSQEVNGERAICADGRVKRRPSHPLSELEASSPARGVAGRLSSASASIAAITTEVEGDERFVPAA